MGPAASDGARGARNARKAGAPAPGLRRPGPEARAGDMSVNPAKFIQEVRAEAAKVVWPTRRETTVATLTVFLMATVAAIFFFVIDTIIGFGVEGVLSLAG